MKTTAGIFAFFFGLCLTAQTPDSISVRQVSPVKYANRPIQKVDRIAVPVDSQVGLYGDYTVTGYSILSTKTPGSEELNMLIGTIVKFQATSITGTAIDPLTFEIYQVERQRRDDYIYRVFGREIKAPEPNLPESFNVHKTDNENCYGIVEIGNGEIAVPYRGVLLYLKHN
ncbi:MAG: hypothetical protein HYZ14_00085 [Bacteroidetes bacterium]|nr:hypothetical protein [Bacteroidota bacterium]